MKQLTTTTTPIHDDTSTYTAYMGYNYVIANIDTSGDYYVVTTPKKDEKAERIRNLNKLVQRWR